MMRGRASLLPYIVASLLGLFLFYRLSHVNYKITNLGTPRDYHSELSLLYPGLSIADAYSNTKPIKSNNKINTDSTNSKNGNDSTKQKSINTTSPFVGSYGKTFDNIIDFWVVWSKIITDANPGVEKITFSEDQGYDAWDGQGANERIFLNDTISNPQEDIDRLTKAHAKFAKHLDLTPNVESLFSGYGVVFLGGGVYTGPAITSIQMLRRTGCDLPIEMFVANQDEYEEYLCKEYLPRYNATCLVISNFLDKGTHVELTKYQYKAFALLFSSFRHTLMLDSDNISLVDPYVELFTQEPYISTGYITWPDYWFGAESTTFYKIVGFKELPKDLPRITTESGQLMIDKVSHIRSLLHTIYLNVYGPDVYYALQSRHTAGEGDKETFMAGPLIAREPWYQVRKRVAPVFNDNGKDKKGTAMVQAHPGQDFVNRKKYPESKDFEQHNDEIKSVFFHANAIKMGAGHILKQMPELRADAFDYRRMRMFGPKAYQIELFGYDIETVLWDLLLETGCELGPKLSLWSDNPALCRELHEHVDLLFEPERAEDASSKSKRKEIK